MEIHWAVFGEQSGGHALLGASGNSSFAARLAQHTDRPGDPPMGTEWGPVDSGFFFGSHYVLLRTFPDVTAGRAGMVRSYAAYVPVPQLATLRSLANIFNQLPKELADFPAPVAPLHADDSASTSALRPPPLGLLAIARQLGSSNSTLPLVWADARPYLPTVDAIWARLPISLRPAFAFGFQFAPEHNLPVKPTLVATLPSLKSRWPANQLIDYAADSPENLNIAQSWFAGRAEGRVFGQTLTDYGIGVTDFRELSLLASFAELVTRLPELTFAEASKAIRIVEKYAKEKRPPSGRQPLFSKLCSLVSTATPEELARLRNLDAEALADLIAPLQAAIEAWIAAVTLSEKHIAALETAVASPSNWWSKPLLSWLRTLVRRPEGAAAEKVYRLLASAPLAKFISGSLPTDSQTEDELVRAIPGTLLRADADRISVVALERSWMRLHAMLLLRSRPEAEAILSHLKVADEATAGLLLIYGELGFASIFRVACESSEAKLISFVGEQLSDNLADASGPSISKCAQWYRILVRTIEKSSGRVSSTLRPLVLSALEHPNSKKPGLTELCAASIDYDATLWLQVSNPSGILDQLTVGAKVNALAKINAHVMDEVKAGKTISLANPEKFQHILDVAAIMRTLTSLPASAAAKAGASVFGSIPFLSDEDCCRWLIDLFTRTHRSRLSADDVTALAALLLEREFPMAAQIVQETAENFSRDDVVPLFEQIRYKYQLTMNYAPSTAGKATRLPRVVVATALPLERAEVINHLGATTYNPDLYADVAFWPADEPMFEVYVLSTGAGNLQAQRATLKAMTLKPKLAFFVGIGGGLKDSKIGDVTYSTKVYYYEGGKEEDDGMKSRPASESTSEDLVQLAHRVADQEWYRGDNTVGSSSARATPAVVASGENVLASDAKDAVTRRHIKVAYNDAQIVEMEGFGFLNACRYSKVPHAMVIRGVSDKLANKTNAESTGSQPLAARNAAAFLFALLRMCPGMLTPKKKKKRGKLSRLLRRK